MDRIWINRLPVLAAVSTVWLSPCQGSQNVRVAETPAGNILADAVRLIGKADGALVPASALQAETEPAQLAPAELLVRMVTAQDPVVVVRLRGAQLRAALERSVTYLGKPFAGFLQVSGIALQVDGTRPVGNRLITVTVAGNPLDPAKEYRIAMPKPLADGQLGYFQFWTKQQVLHDKGRTLEDAVKELAGQSPMPRGVESRIRIRHEGKPQ